MLNIRITSATQSEQNWRTDGWPPMAHTRRESPSNRRSRDKEFQAQCGNLEIRCGFPLVPAFLKERCLVRALNILDARREILTFAVPLLLHIID
jgi:hypothetical protein